MIYYATLIVVFIVTFSCLVGFYTRIWIAIKHRRDTVISDQVSPNYSASRKFRISRNSTSDGESTNSSLATTAINKKTHKLTGISESRRIKLSRTTIIFLSVSIVFVVSYLPGIVISIVRTVVDDFDATVTPSVEVIIKLFSRFHLISSSVNPIVYSFFNTNFRAQCSKLITSIALCCKRPIETVTSSSRKTSKESQFSDVCR